MPPHPSNPPHSPSQQAQATAPNTACGVARAGLRPSGEQAREKLLHAALRLFAEHGYSKASTREIAAAAGANIGAISYYFGDKQGLYRAAFTEPMGCASETFAHMASPNPSLHEVLNKLFQTMLEPLKMGELARLSIRLHYREMTEPTGLWQQEIDDGIKPAHGALVQVLLRELNLSEPDDDVQRLAFSIIAQGVFCFMGRDVIDAIAPQLQSSPEAIDASTAHFTRCAVAMIDAESKHRANPPKRPK